MAELAIGKALEQLGGSVKIYKTLINGFIDKYSNVAGEIKSDLLNENFADAKRSAHSMKGLGGNLGANEFKSKAKLLESGIKEIENGSYDPVKITDVLTTEWRMFAKEHEELLKELIRIQYIEDEAFLKVTFSDELVDTVENSGAKISAESKMDDGEELSKFITELTTCNYEVIMKSFKRLNPYELGIEPGIKWKKLVEAINEFEYSEAKKILMGGVYNDQ